MKTLLCHNFQGSEHHWHSYHYAKTFQGYNYFVLAGWSKSGTHDGFIWANEDRWSVDTPENPHSILPLMFDGRWLSGPELSNFGERTVIEDHGEGFLKINVNLTGCAAEFLIGGDGLNLYGGRTLFWIFGDGARWHYLDPLDVPQGEVKLNIVNLVPDDSRWHRSWGTDDKAGKTIARSLAYVSSWGFSFVGFERPADGIFMLYAFRITSDD